MKAQNRKTSSIFRFITRNILNIFAIVSVALLVFTGSHSYAVDKKTSAGSPVVAVQKVSLNKADADTLASILNGVGIKKAEAIVAYRKANGKFKSINQLTEVKGIGESILEKNKALITL